MAAKQQIEQRVTFPNFTATANLDSEKAQVERGTITYAGKYLVIDLVRSMKVVKFGGSFLPASIWEGKKELWNFKRMEDFAGGQAYLVDIEGEPVIAFARYKRVERVRSFAEIVLGKKDNLRKQIGLKRSATKKLGMQFDLSEAEKRLQKKEVEKAEREQAKRAEERRQRKAERQDAILRRPHVHVWTEDGKPRHGHPCVGTEWHSLPRYSYVVLVEYYNEQTGEHRNVIEAFQVDKSAGGKPRRIHPAPVTETKPEFHRNTKLEIPRADHEIIVDISKDEDGSEPNLVAVYRDMQVIQTARARGLNGGALVAFSVPDGEKYQVMRVFEDGIKSVCERYPYA